VSDTCLGAARFLPDSDGRRSAATSSLASRRSATICTNAVGSIEATAKAVIAAGGKTVIPKSIIVGVGALMFFQDPEGDVFGAMEFDRHVE